MTQDEALRSLTNAELATVVAELEARAELFDAATRQKVNDELRRRRMPIIGGRR